jgi:tetratricopeptide (TPR) repeat protein
VAKPPATGDDLEVPNERVRQQILERRRWLRAVLESGKATRKQQAEGWGELGNLYHAYDLLDLAEAGYREAEKLAPEDFRWPYYLGQLYRTRNDAARSLAGFTRAVEKKGDDVAAQVRLGEVLFDQQRMDEAKRHLELALTLDSKCAAAHFTLGLIANAAGDRAGAARHFEAALALQPDASAVRNPLGLAYRDLGRLDEARAQLAQAGKTEVALDDPLMAKVWELADGLVQALARGDKAAQAGDLKEATAAYRAAVAADPLYSLPRVRLALALLHGGEMAGGAAAAREQLEIALRLSPGDPDARSALGYVLLEEGKPAEAARELRAGLAARPDDTAARFNLARALLDAGQGAAAAEEYGRLAERAPQNPLLWLGKASGSLAAGRCAEARGAIEAGLAALPQDGLLSQALARLLASCPGEGVRDGQRAFDLASALYEARPGPEHAEAVAMALAELGRWGEAVEWQRRALEEATTGGKKDLAVEVQGNLALFEKNRPSRNPWPPRSWVLLLGRS